MNMFWKKISCVVFTAQVVIPVIAVIIYFAADYFFDLPPAALEFYSEVVKAQPMGEKLLIEGEYHFRAHHPRKKSYELGFPIYETGGQSAPENVEVAVNGKPIPYVLHSQGLSYRMPANPGAESIMTVAYTISASQKSAVYITRTANLWHKAITRVEFILPEGASSNYHKPGETSAVFHGFRPKENWVIKWK